MRLSRPHRALFLILSGLLPVFATAATQDAAVSTGPAEPQIEERASQALRAMSDYLKASKSYSFHADIDWDDVLPSGQKITFTAVSEVNLRRPNGLQAEQIADTGTKRFWFDGKALTLFDPVRHTYAVEPFSGNTDQALDHMIKTLHFTLPLSDFVYENPAKALTGTARYGFVVGRSNVDGIPCQHLAFVDSHIDWQLWIDAGRIPVPRKLVINYKNLPGSPTFSATLSDWDFSTRLPDSLFVADIPGDAVRLPFLKKDLALPAKAAPIEPKNP